jgi:hypothetical protein
MNLGKRTIEVVGLKWGKWGIFKLPHYIMSNHLNELCTVSGVSGVLWGDLIFTDSWIQNSARASAQKYPHLLHFYKYNYMCLHKLAASGVFAFLKTIPYLPHLKRYIYNISVVR